jgi:hypothetical protein
MTRHGSPHLSEGILGLQASRSSFEPDHGTSSGRWAALERPNWTRGKMALSSIIDAFPGPAVIFSMIAGAVIVALPMLVLLPSAKEKKLCDQSVSTFFTTTDAIELQRAMFLIRRLDCKISTRL